MHVGKRGLLFRFLSDLLGLGRYVAWVEVLGSVSELKDI